MTAGIHIQAKPYGRHFLNWISFLNWECPIWTCLPGGAEFIGKTPFMQSYFNNVKKSKLLQQCISTHLKLMCYPWYVMQSGETHHLKVHIFFHSYFACFLHDTYIQSSFYFGKNCPECLPEWHVKGFLLYMTFKYEVGQSMILGLASSILYIEIECTYISLL